LLKQRAKDTNYIRKKQKNFAKNLGNIHYYYLWQSFLFLLFQIRNTIQHKKTL